MFTEDRPIFLQLADQIANDIFRGRYAEGEQVPSTNELAQVLRINPATAGKALNTLVDRGMLEKRRGIGMFVATGAVERLHEERTTAFVTEFIRPLIAEAQALGLSHDTVQRLIEQEGETP